MAGLQAAGPGGQAGCELSPHPLLDNGPRGPEFGLAHLPHRLPGRLLLGTRPGLVSSAGWQMLTEALTGLLFEKSAEYDKNEQTKSLFRLNLSVRS